ncbi:MAG: phospho-N-acetylmuramoyl-pentapeptide-transferase [Candidatus Bipolaricaulaceae bacterium]
MSAPVAALATALAALPVVAAGASWYARAVRAGQYIRPEGPAAHAAKAGTPTMGGIVLLAGLSAGAGLAGAGGAPLSPQVGFAMAATWAAGLIGLWDDLLSQRRRASLGLSVAQKLLLQAAAAAGLFALLPALGEVQLTVPFSARAIPLSSLPAWALFLLVTIAFAGITNTVNLADGLDGLACGAALVVLAGVLPLVWGQPDLASLCFVACGAAGGFLWVNAHPARVFLGDVGAMGLGGLLFGVTFAAGHVFLLPILGGLFVLEGLSVVLQVAAYKLTGVRLFKMSPLHHHLEAGTAPWPHRLPGRSWSEPQVVVRLWLVCAAFVLLGLWAGRA